MAYLTGFPPAGSDDPEAEDYTREAADYWAWYEAQESRRKDF
jgi:hypothetical protein